MPVSSIAKCPFHECTLLWARTHDGSITWPYIGTAIQHHGHWNSSSLECYSFVYLGYYSEDVSPCITYVMVGTVVPRSVNKQRSFFLNEVELSLNSMNSTNSGNLIDHCSMNWGQFKGHLCYLCLHGAVVWSLLLMQQVVDSRLTFYKNFVNEFTEFSEGHLGKTPIWHHYKKRIRIFLTTATSFFYTIPYSIYFHITGLAINHAVCSFHVWSPLFVH